MARRWKTSPAEDLIELVAMLPWWAGVTIAVLSSLLLHQVAAQSFAAPAKSGHVKARPTWPNWSACSSSGTIQRLP
jgi:restriction system protein